MGGSDRRSPIPPTGNPRGDERGELRRQSRRSKDQRTRAAYDERIFWGGRSMTTSDEGDFVRRAHRVLPGGVLGSHRSGDGLEFVVKEGRGAYLWDTQGRKYIDYLLGSGPMVLGHAHPAVVEAVRKHLAHGTTYMLVNRSEEHT